MVSMLSYHKFGHPLVGQSSFAELVEVWHGKEGFYLVVSRDVVSRDVVRDTFVKDLKVQVVLSSSELREVQDGSTFSRRKPCHA